MSSTHWNTVDKVKSGMMSITITLLRPFYKLIRALMRYLKKNKLKNEFILSPVFDSFDNMIDQVYRLTWYLPKREGVIIKIYYHGFEFSEQDLLDDSNRPGHMHSLPINLKNIRFVKTKNLWVSEICTLLSAVLGSQIIVWEEPRRNGDYLRKITTLTGNGIIVDHKNRSYASDVNYVALSCRRTEPTELDEIHDLSKSVFSKEVESLRKTYKKVYIFGRGPSLSAAFNFDFSDGARILCNQIVHDQKIMKHINPNFIAAGDHCWHYGCSKMADHFRKDLINYVMKNEVVFLMPLEAYPLMAHHYPEIKEKMAGIPHSGDKVNFNLVDNFFTKGGVSVLIEFLFPVACTIADDIKMLGFDGGDKPDTVSPQDKVSYSHYRAAVYPAEIVDSINASRPGYYDSDFSNFRKLTSTVYQTYDSELESMLDEAEGEGFQIETLAPSNLRGLKSRFRGSTGKSGLK